MTPLAQEIPDYYEISKLASKRITHQKFSGKHDFTSGTITFLDDKDKKVKELDYNVQEGGAIVEVTKYFDQAGNLIMDATTLNRNIVLGLDIYEYDVDNYLIGTVKYRYGGYKTKVKHPKKYKAEDLERIEGQAIKEEKTVIWQGVDPDW